MKTLTEAIAAIESMQAQIKSLEDAVTEIVTGRQRGPKVERSMTEVDAHRVKFGDLKDLNHKEAAAALGLSYGQIFSCRGGYTFKQVKSTWTPPITPVSTTAPAEGAKE